MVSSDVLPELNVLSPEGGGVVGLAGVRRSFGLLAGYRPGHWHRVPRVGVTLMILQKLKKREGKQKQSQVRRGGGMKEKEAR